MRTPSPAEVRTIACRSWSSRSASPGSKPSFSRNSAGDGGRPSRAKVVKISARTARASDVTAPRGPRRRPARPPPASCATTTAARGGDRRRSRRRARSHRCVRRVLGERVQHRVTGGLHAARGDHGAGRPAPRRTRNRIGNAKCDPASTAASSHISSTRPARRARRGTPTPPRADGDRSPHAREPGQAERRPRLVEPEVEADVDHVVGVLVPAVAVPGARRHRVRAQQPHALARAPRRRSGPSRPRPRRAASWRRTRGSRARPPSPRVRRPRRRAPSACAASSIRCEARARRTARAARASVGGVAAHVDGDHRAGARRDPRARRRPRIEVAAPRSETTSASTGTRAPRSAAHARWPGT